MAIFSVDKKHVEPSSLKRAKPDVYGHKYPIESNEIITEALSLFNEEIDKLADKDREGIAKAEKRCPEIINTKEHKLMFLRSDNFMVDLAAKRFANYWNKRIELFGEKAFSPLTISDSLNNDKEALNTAFCKLLKAKDDVGRSIIYMDPALLDDSKYTRDSMLRVIWYVVHVALEEKETQQRGIIFVNNNGNNPEIRQFDRVLVGKIAHSLQHEIPIIIGALYILHIPRLLVVFMNVIKHVLGSGISKQMKVVGGSNQMILQKLDKHGMYKEDMPVDIGGDLKYDNESWVRQRVEAES
mmetsp:Transcript_27389/g.36368  ORF Transcript_27389/g.36368 Transcript_27389/m.36368 type:complete len:298 (-) Transcript_27389:101-994(-)